MKQRFFLLAYFIVLGLLSKPAIAQIRGHIFRDVNANGSFDEGTEHGLPLIRVNAYDRLGQLLATVSSDSAGYYSMPRLPAQAIRLQFDKVPTGFFPSQGHFLTRFISTVNGPQNLGLYQPAAYVGNNPQLAISIQPLGNHSDTRTDSLGISTIRLLQADASQSADKQWASPAVTGSVWGLAFDRTRNTLYSAALAKRHSGFGSLGSGGIYQTDLATGQTKPFVSLDALGVPTGPPNLSRDLSATYEGAMKDSLMYAWVGKMGLGGIDLSDDDRILYTVSLYDRKLYALQLPANGQSPATSDLIGYALPKSGCKGGTFRPFAVKTHDDKVYVGGVCDALHSGKAADLRGIVYAFDPVTKGIQEVLSIPLNYQRGAIEYGVGNWFAWTDNPKDVMLAEPAWWAIHPQPMLSDLEFDADGSILLGFMDRLGHQMATGKGTADGRWQQTVSMAAGDVLRATPKRKTYQLEANARAGERRSAGGNNAQGPDGGEFYFDDAFTLQGTRYHQENGMGGLAVLSDKGQILVSSREPIAEYNSAGITTYDNQTGKKVSGLAAYHHNPAIEFVGRKTNHVGDVEVIGALPTTFLGHRIWQDCNEDGVQNADEPGLAGVTVELWQQTTKLASTQTDSAGIYSFDSRALPNGLPSATVYELRVPYQQNRYSQLQLATPVLKSQTDNGFGTAVAESTYALIRLKASAPGENQFNLDFGFRCVEKPQTTATLHCSGTEWSNAQISLVLTNAQPSERYDMTLTPTYTGRAEYASATVIPATGQLLKQPLASLTESDLSIRIINPGGCYQDVFVNLTQSPECVRLLTDSADEHTTGLRLSPNPTHDKVVVRYMTNVKSPVILQLLSANSHQLQQETLTPAADGLVQTTLDLTRHSPGIYIISLQQGATTISRKLIRH